MTRGKKDSPPPGAALERDLIGREFSNAVIFFHESVAAHLGLSTAEWKCLGLLDQHGPSTAGRLADLSGFTTGAITGIVGRLERAGFAQRDTNPSDRRSVVVRPLRVQELRAWVAPIFQGLGRALAAVAEHYTPAELAAIDGYFRESTQALLAETAKIKSMKREPVPAPPAVRKR